ncbi:MULTISPECIES: phasin family protein [Pseudovibrio]|uniref:phasin family protein n=1 Tax=Stappiaceae TaxID=2821832 RepID=UPI00236520DF|nr:MULTISPECIES: phasin family protein [Pseudovibrio]MDD7912125.1 phasin family protein [Pseudovibrio exalbescens]MDX5592473.1 phasin family protein [Pseudovibrio sp. SPO723]
MSQDKMSFEIPEQMRDMADKSLEQAKKAFEDYVSMTHGTLGNIEAAATTAQSEGAELNKQAVAFAEENISSAFDYAQKLCAATSYNELMELNKAFMEKQMQIAGEQARVMSDKTAHAASETAKKFTEK